jgi:hypothetical protein
VTRLRQHLRHPRELAVKWTADQGPNETWSPGLIENLSGGGARLKLPRAVPVGSLVRLVVLLDGWRLEGDRLVAAEGRGRLNCLAQVMWTERIDLDRTVCGVKFIGRTLDADPGEES